MNTKKETVTKIFQRERTLDFIIFILPLLFKALEFLLTSGNAGAKSMNGVWSGSAEPLPDEHKRLTGSMLTEPPRFSSEIEAQDAVSQNRN